MHRKYDRFLKADVETSITKDTFIKCYQNLSEEHWNRILEASVVLAANRLSPIVRQVTNEGMNNRCIEYDKVRPFDADRIPRDLKAVPKYDIVAKINKMVQKLHSLGYGHGDLHIANMGVSGGIIYFLDLDTVYKLESLKRPAEWLHRWIVETHDSAPVEEFYLRDYDTWDSDWLSKSEETDFSQS